jgi:oxaloacetate decarboxylase
MSSIDQRRRFRAILAGDQCVKPASVFDPISARLAEDLEFETGILAGSVASLVVLGAPDLVVMTLTELADQVRRITRASGLPLLVDADHGYGNALSVMRTVQELEVAGVSALTIEDTQLPQAYGSLEAKLIPMKEGLGKLRAALAARRDHTLVIVARTSAMKITGTDDAVARARAYTQAGADALFFSGISTMTQLQAVRTVTDLPIILGSTEGDLGEPGGLAAHGVRMSLQGHQPFLAALQAIHSTLKALREGADQKHWPGGPSGELMKQVTRNQSYATAIKDFMGVG